MHKINYFAVNVVLFIALMFALLFAGCATTPVVEIPENGSKIIYKLIIQNNWLLTLSILGVGAGFFAFLNGNSKGISIMASCFVVMSVVLMIAKFAVWMAIITLVGATSLLLYTIIIRSRALKEVVAGVQTYRNTIDTTHMDTDLKHVQSSQTQKLVKKIKKGLKL